MPPLWLAELRVRRCDTAKVRGRAGGLHCLTLVPRSFIIIPQSFSMPQVGWSVADIAQMTGRTPPAWRTNWKPEAGDGMGFQSPFLSILLPGMHPNPHVSRRCPRCHQPLKRPVDTLFSSDEIHVGGDGNPGSHFTFCMLHLVAGYVLVLYQSFIPCFIYI